MRDLARDRARELVAACWTESLKARRSLVPRVTAVGFGLAPLVGGLFMFIVAEPERARSMGLLAAKAQLSGATADWPGYFGLLGKANDQRALVITITLICSLYEQDTSVQTWRSPTREAQRYLAALKEWGYGLSKIEQSVLDGKPAW